jgi:hypothetical protein
VGQLGDCVQNGDQQEIEWKRADTAMSRIESQAFTGLTQGIPYGICVGNHDQSPLSSGSDGTTARYNQYFGSSRFNGRNYYGGHQGSNNDNHYGLFSASGIDFLVISLEYDETPETIVLDWAQNLVQTYSQRKVIVMTHYGIDDVASGIPPFGVMGQAIYNRLKQYPNFILFVCGHNYSTDGEARRIDTYNGNTLHTILSDYQGRSNGGHGLLRIMEFDPVTNKVSVKTFSPYDNNGAGAYETDADSQFELSVNLYSLIGESASVSSGTNTCKTWANLNQFTNYEWYMELYDGTSITNGPVWTFATPGNSPLPVDLLSFNAQVESSKRIKINWTTSYERDNSHFEIERSKDKVNFMSIITVPSMGNSNGLQSYSIYDDQPGSGISFYRLKQVDIDGKITYSKIERVNISDSKSVADIFPNPADHKSFNINLLKDAREAIDIKVYDMKGRLQLHQQFNDNRNIIVNHHLASGVYIVKITTGGLAENKKLVIK